MQEPYKVAVVGAGWAGCAAAVELQRAGAHVTLFEASKTPGGRARTVEVQSKLGTHHNIKLDNGQHILLGAYRECLRLMQAVGVEPQRVLTQQTLALTYSSLQRGFTLGSLPHFFGLGAALNVLVAILKHDSWNWRDKWQLLHTAGRWQLTGFTAPPKQTVAQLCAPLTPAVVRDLIEPLCVSALNVPPHLASAQVFLRVLHDALLGPAKPKHVATKTPQTLANPYRSSDALIPRVPLGNVFPEPALAWLAKAGGSVRLGTRVKQLVPAAANAAETRGCWVITMQETEAKQGIEQPELQTHRERFDAVVLATHPANASALLGEQASFDCTAWQARVQALQHTAIATVYAQCVHLPEHWRGLPMVLLPCTQAHQAQFVFVKATSTMNAASGQTPAASAPYTLAFVISYATGSRDEVQAAVRAQAAAQGCTLDVLNTFLEKRAAFMPSTELKRPDTAIFKGSGDLANNNFFPVYAAGDYTHPFYPSTLEGAVQSGVAAAHAVLRSKL